MAFMMKKKKYKFNIEVQLEDLVEVALVNEVVFAKIRLLDGGSFQEYSTREEVRNHRVEWNRSFEFPCKMSANASTGVLDPCYLRISIRKEMKGGRSYYKLGFIDINLAEFAGAGLTSRRFLLEGYDSRHRLDNSMLRVSIKMHMLSGDILFKAPTPNVKSKQKPSTDKPSTTSTGAGLQTSTATTAPTIGSGATLCGGSGLTITRPVSTVREGDLDPQTLIPSVVTDSGLSESSESAATQAIDGGVHMQHNLGIAHYNNQTGTLVPGLALTNAQQQHALTGNSGNGSSGGVIGSNNCGTLTNFSGGNGGGGGTGVTSGTSSLMEMGHSRNSSNTSQMSKGSGYSSFSHSQHSRQSSEGDSGHARFSKAVSLHNRLNQRTMNTMKLNINVMQQHAMKTSNGGNTNNEYEDCEETLFRTPNSTLNSNDLQTLEEFRTPLNEIPSFDCCYDNRSRRTSSSTCRSVVSNNQSDTNSHERRECGCSGNGSAKSTIPSSLPSGSESESTEDSGLDENYHTPRVSKIKSMENLSILEMEFYKASQALDRNSPRRLKLLAERAKIPKMKSLNNICFNNLSDGQVREELQRILEQAREEKLRFNYEQRKKHFARNKVGHTKFIGIEESNPQPQQMIDFPPFPIQKMRSMGTITDGVAERILTDPFLTPTSNRKPQFPMTTQSAEKPTPSSYIKRLMTYDTVDSSRMNDAGAVAGPGAGHHHNQHQYYTHNEAIYNHDRFDDFLSNNPDTTSVLFMSQTPFERAFRRSQMRNSTPHHQSSGLASYATGEEIERERQQFEQFSHQHKNYHNHMQHEAQIVRPHSTNADFASMRSFSGVPRRLLDGSNRQISSISAATISANLAMLACNNASSSPSGTLSSIHSTHSASSSSGSSSSGAAITFQCASSNSNQTGNGDWMDSPSMHQQQYQQQQQQQQQLVGSPGNGHYMNIFLAGNSGTSSPRGCSGGGGGGDALSSLAASPTDACSIRSNPSAASLLLQTSSAAAAETAIAPSASGATLSPLATTQIMRRPSVTMIPSSGSLVISETGSLDRIKNPVEKRMKGPLDDGLRVSDRVEETRVNPNSLIDEILKDTKLDQLEESAETSGLKLYIARDGTASLGSHEAKSRIGAGAFKQVVMQHPR